MGDDREVSGEHDQDLTDEMLAEQARDGDPHAFQMLYERHEARLRRRIRERLPRRLRRKASESDVIQMAFLGVHHGLQRFTVRGEGSFAAWLDEIVEHKILDLVRRYVRAGKRNVLQEITGALLVDQWPQEPTDASPSAAAMANELEERIAAAMTRLPEDYRLVLQLVRQDGLTLAEAGRLMGRSTGAAEKLYGRALVRLAALARTDRGDDG